MAGDQVSIGVKGKACYGVDASYPLQAPYPNNIMVEITNACNLRCSMCYHKEMKRPVRMMDVELFRRIVQEAKDLGIENMGLYTVGEAFLHPQAMEMIRIAKEGGIQYVYVTVNGNSLDEQKIYALMDSGLDSIKFSIDAACKESYEKVRKGGNWDKLLSNVRLLRRLRDERGSRLRIFGSFVATKDNYLDLLDYSTVWGGLLDESNFSFVGTQGGQMLEFDGGKETELAPCGLLWNRFIVTCDGKLTVCCVDFEAKLIYADLANTTLKEAWNNEAIQRFRKMHRSLKFKEMPLCGGCDIVRKRPPAETRKYGKA